jgi:hypothetical protein
MRIWAEEKDRDQQHWLPSSRASKKIDYLTPNLIPKLNLIEEF